MKRIALGTSASLLVILLVSPHAKADPIVEQTTVTTGFDTDATVDADDIDDDDAPVQPIRRPYRWGGPELAGYDYIPSTVATEQTTIVRRPVVHETIVEDTDGPRVRPDYVAPPIRGSFRQAATTRSYEAAYERGYGVRSAGYGVNVRRDERYGVRTHLSGRSYGVERDLRGRQGIRNASVHSDGFARAEVGVGRGSARSAHLGEGGRDGIHTVSSAERGSIGRRTQLRGNVAVGSGRGGTGVEAGVNARSQLR